MSAATRLLSGLSISFLLAIVVPVTAVADTTTSATQPLITVSPPLKQLTLGPGLLEATTRVGLTNNTSHVFSASIKLVDFKTLEQTGGITLGQVGVPLWQYGLANWMSLPGGNQVTLAPGQHTDISVNVANRSDLTPGGHYGAVVISASGGSQSGNNTVNFNQNLISLLFVKKLGGEHYGLNLQSLKTNQRFDLPTSVTTVFKSTGNIYVIPRGYIEVTGPTGKLVEKGIINLDSRMILQGSSEQLITLLQPISDSGAIGRYKLTAYYRYDGQNDYSTKTIYFNRGGLTPKNAVLVVIILLILVGGPLLARHKLKK